MKNDYVEKPAVTIDTMDNENPLFVLHNYIRQNKLVVLNKSEASLLYIELHKFLTNSAELEEKVNKKK